MVLAIEDANPLSLSRGYVCHCTHSDHRACQWTGVGQMNELHKGKGTSVSAVMAISRSPLKFAFLLFIHNQIALSGATSVFS